MTSHDSAGPRDWQVGDFVRFNAPTGSIGKVIGVRNDRFDCEWVYGRNVHNEVMRAVSCSIHRYSLVASTEAEYEAMANRKGFGS